MRYTWGHEERKVNKQTVSTASSDWWNRNAYDRDTAKMWEPQIEAMGVHQESSEFSLVLSL